MFKKIFEELCAKNNEAPSAVCKKIGLSNAAYSCWNENSLPRKTTLIKIAEYFNVTIEYLKGEEKEKTSNIEVNADVMDKSNIHLIPVFESVSGGLGIIANSNPIDYTPMFFFTHTEAQNTIIVKVKGNSMAPKIQEGDMIQVYKTENIPNGTVGVVLIDKEEALVKNVYYGYGWIELRSENPDYKTIRFEKEETNRVEFVGQVKKVIRDIQI